LILALLNALRSLSNPRPTRIRIALLVGIASLALPVSSPAQEIPAGVARETLVVERPAVGDWPGGGSGDPAVGDGASLTTGERIAVWIRGAARVGEPGAAPLPVGEAAPGEVVARFAGGRWFAWPRDPVVWTAPAPGRLDFALNGSTAHELDGVADVVLVRLGGPGSPPPEWFPPPWVGLERVAAGVEARYRDRAGFGLDTRTLRFTIETARGVRIQMAPWSPVGREATVLPLPPPGIALPPGIHRLSVTVTDRVGRDAAPATIVFDAAP
jgi:hypothetical protein